MVAYKDKNTGVAFNFKLSAKEIMDTYSEKTMHDDILQRIEDIEEELRKLDEHKNRNE